MNVAPATDAPDSELFWLAKLDDAPQLTGEHERLFVSETAGTSLLVRRPPQNDAELARRTGIVLLLDGELFDTDPLTTALGWGTDSRGSTQAELLLEAYRACGLDVFRLLHGEFAILIWHESSGDLVLARDPLGARPLSYGQRGGRFYVSPSPELLVESGIPGDINRAAVAEWVLMVSIETSQTFYTHVRRLSPGRVLERRRGCHSVRPYWRPDESDSPADPREAHERFDDLLRQSVRRGLPELHAGVFLSGGVDSAAVAAVLASESARMNLAPPLALALRFPEVGVDESAVQRWTAAALELPLHMTTLGEAVGPDGVLVAGLRTSARGWFPALNPWAAAYDALALDAAGFGCRLLLTGEGGNELLEPTWDELSDLLIKWRGHELRQAARAWVDYVPSTRHSAVYKAVLRRSLARTVRRVASDERWRNRLVKLLMRRPRFGVPTWLLPHQDLLRRELLEKRAGASFRNTCHESPLADPFGAAAMLEGSHLQGRRLGISIRHPYYDSKLFSLRRALPLESVLFEGRYKGLGHASYERRASGRGTSPLRAVAAGHWFGTLLDAETPAALRYLGGLPNLEKWGIIESGLTVERSSGSLLASLGDYRRWHILACEAWLGARGKGKSNE